VDWNEDGLKDLIVGEWDGHVRYYQNVGAATNPVLHYVGLIQDGSVPLYMGIYSTPWVDDWNGDGRKDLLVGEANGRIALYLNVGTNANPIFHGYNWLTYPGGGQVDVGLRSCPNVVDMDNDGIKDLVSGSEDGKIYYLHNSGTNNNPVLDQMAPTTLGSEPVAVPLGTTRTVPIDWNNDGEMDLMVGSYDALVRLYLRTAATVPNVTCDVNAFGTGLIPSSGGTLNYSLSAANPTSAPKTFDAWTMLLLSNMSLTSLVNRPNLTLAPGGSLSRTLSMNIPASWASGLYTYYGFVGNHTTLQVYSTDEFTFFKSVGGDGPIISEFSFTDWGDEVVTAAATVPIPNEAALTASPNPFNPCTTISYDLPAAGQVEVAIFNAAGRRVATLVNGYRGAGTHQITWEAAGMPSGIYIITFDAGHHHTAQKVTLLK
jgi:hypothetical protein